MDDARDTSSPDAVPPDAGPPDADTPPARLFGPRDVGQILRGVLMGAADTVPGVSGGTVALVLGIYPRLVAAVGSVDGELIRLLRHGRWADAARHVDLRFLAFLLAGVGAGVVTLAGLMGWLLEHRRQPTFASFFGLILGSTWVVAKLVPRWTAARSLLGVAAAVAAFLLVGIPALQNPPVGPAYLFLCGAVAICAMILPGVSGAFLLLILGVYHHVTDWVRTLRDGTVPPGFGAEAPAFAAGMMLGLLSFAKVLRWLLNRHPGATLAVLTGLMLGSLRKLWPFAIDLAPELPFKEKTFEPVLPDPSAADTWVAAGLAVGGVLAVLALDRWGRARVDEELPPPPPRPQ